MPPLSDIERRRHAHVMDAAWQRVQELLADGFTLLDIHHWSGIDSWTLKRTMERGWFTYKMASRIMDAEGNPSYSFKTIQGLLSEEYPHMLAALGDKELACRRLADAYGVTPFQVAQWLNNEGADIPWRRLVDGYDPWPANNRGFKGEELM